MISVILPTANRPAMLRTALASIARQTALAKISRVHVSENGGNCESEAVCAEFPTLPIRYYFRAPASTPLQHAKLLVEECADGELTAYLHDDDWWTPAHLAHAIEALESHPDAAAYGSSHFVVSGEASMLNCSGNLFPWFGANYAVIEPVWELSRANMLMALLLGTTSHYSTMVMRSVAMKQAAYVFDLGNPFDNDRMLLFALSAFGPLLFNPVPEAFVRNHRVQDCFVFNDEARRKHMCETTRWMVETSGKSWDVVAQAFNRRMAICPAEATGTLQVLAQKEWCVPEMNRHVRAPIGMRTTSQREVAAAG